MPQRPRQHQIEDESRRVFSSKLPPQWLFHDEIRDYGIDGRVEIFDENNLGTGRMFLVQLKATDQPDLNRALAIRLTRDQDRYYRLLDIPVLIARYHTPTRTVFVKWHHTFDPYYSKRGARTLTLRLSPSDEWRDQTASTLASELEAIRKVRSPQITVPIPCTLKINGEEVHGVTSAHMELLIRRAVDRLPRIISLVEGDALASMVVATEEISVTLADGKGFTLHTTKGYPSEFARSKFPNDVCMALAAALYHGGHYNVAAQVIAEYAPNSSLISQTELALHMAHCMVKAQRIIEALRLSETLLKDEAARSIADLVFVVAFSKFDSLSCSEREYYKEYLKRRIEWAEQEGNRVHIAVAHYNLANHLRGTNIREAFRHYKKSAEHDSNYLQRSYFLRELGGVLFLNARYQLAAQFYERSIRLGVELSCQALYADALMLSGKYRLSQEVFEAYLATKPEGASEWELKVFALKYIRSTLGIDEQKRAMVTALKLMGDCSNLPDDEARSSIRRVLQQDALCGLAWFNQGLLELNGGDRSKALLPFLIEALINNWDVEAWCNAMVLSFTSPEHHFLVQDIIETAYRFNGTRYIEQIFKWANSQPKGFPAPEFVEMIVKCLKQLPRKESEPEIRLLKTGSDYEVIHFNESKKLSGSG